jgi:hypothetical protein
MRNAITQYKKVASITPSAKESETKSEMGNKNPHGRGTFPDGEKNQYNEKKPLFTTGTGNDKAHYARQRPIIHRK